ncbi:MAG: type IX secretion system membrane protein PorP/SprF [Sphingobacteriales bacterium]|nr:type IX secretion system membrane protein PorP/SprF [Sphingobacteriales bacterium]
MKRLTAIAVLLIQGLYQLHGQDPHFTQFYANPLYLNPAMAGAAGEHRIISNYRNQWPNIEGSYVTYCMSYDGHYDAIMGGIGAQVLYDRAGVGQLSHYMWNFMYAYQLNVSRKFTIKAGLQAQFHQFSIDFDLLTFYDQIEPRKGFVKPTSEPLPNGGGIYKTKLVNDFAAGIMGYTSKFYFGYAMHHIITPTISFYSSSESYIPQKSTVHLGMMIPMEAGRDPKQFFSPNILFQQQHHFWQANIGAYYIMDYLIGGVWYRQTSQNTDGLMVLVGLRKDPVKFSYSFDITSSTVRFGSPGSHEISLIFTFKTYKHEPPIKYRKLICPTF